MLRVYFLLCLVVVGKCQIPSLGFCPDYLPMSNFDMERFLGKWYEAERYFQFSEVASRCVVTDYAKGPSGKIYVSNEVTNRLTGIKRVIDGQLEVAGKGNEGKLNVKYSTTPIATESQLTVLETDYENYAVIWSCSGFGPIHAQSVWVMTRRRIAPGPILQEAYGVLDKFKIGRHFFLKTDQEGCAIAASDINAAQGITSVSTIAEATGSDQRKVSLIGEAAKGNSNDVTELSENTEQKEALPVAEVVMAMTSTELNEESQKYTTEKANQGFNIEEIFTEATQKEKIPDVTQAASTLYHE